MCNVCWLSQSLDYCQVLNYKVFAIWSRRKFFLLIFCWILLGRLLTNRTMLIVPYICIFVLCHYIDNSFFVLGHCRVWWVMVLDYRAFDNLMNFEPLVWQLGDDIVDSMFVVRGVVSSPSSFFFIGHGSFCSCPKCFLFVVLMPPRLIISNKCGGWGNSTMGPTWFRPFAYDSMATRFNAVFTEVRK